MKLWMQSLFWTSLVSIPLLSTHQPSGSGAVELTVDMGSGASMDFVRIESLDLWVGKYEVTNAQYRRFMRYRDGSGIQGIDLSGDRQPAVFVSYCDTLGFVHWLNSNVDLPQGFQARLPSGEEWTRLVQAGRERTYPWGESWPPESGNYLDRSGDQALQWGAFIEGYSDGFAATAPVEATARNDWGIHGLGGNVAEWTSESGKKDAWHVIRGASWRDYRKQRLASGFRREGAMWGKDNHIGFRVVLSRKPSPQGGC